MNSELTFAERVHSAICRDLKRNRFGEATDLDQILEKHARFFRKITPTRLKICDAAVAANFCGFTLTERIRLLGNLRSPNVPNGAADFFRRHQLQNTDRTNLVADLEGLLAWGFKVRLASTEDQFELNLRKRLCSLGYFQPCTETTLTYAQLLLKPLPMLEPRLSAESARDLARTILSLMELLPPNPSDKPANRVASNLVALGFHLESLSNYLRIRQDLFSQGASISLNLGFEFDAAWCLQQAGKLAAIQGDLNGLEKLQDDLESLKYEIRSKSPVCEEASVDKGRRLQVFFVAVPASDRATSHLTMAETDQLIAGRRRTLKDKGSIWLDSWFSWISALNPDLSSVLDRISLVDPAIPKGRPLFLGLKLPWDGKPFLSLQAELLRWSAEVEVSEEGQQSLAIDDETCRQAQKEPCFQTFLKSQLEPLLLARPRVLSQADALALGEGLRRAGYRLRHENYLNDAADFYVASLDLFEKSSSTEALARCYRTGAYLALDLGRLDIAMMIVDRSSSLDLLNKSLDGFGQSLYAKALLLGVAGDYQGHYETALHCLGLVQENHCPSLDEWWVHSSIAKASLCLGNLDAALQHLEEGKGHFTTNSPNAPEYLSVKAEVFSQLGRIERATRLFRQAQRLLSPSNVRDQALLRVSKCRHYSRHDKKEQLMTEAMGLIELADRLKDNPIAKEALESFSRELIVGGFPDFQGTHRKIKYPNLAAAS